MTAHRWRQALTALAAVAILSVIGYAALARIGQAAGLRKAAPTSTGAPAERELIWSDAARVDALRRAHVWHQPAVPIHQANLSGEPDDVPDELSCRFVVQVPGGTTPKFDCTPATGGTLRVKYGGGPEPHAEAAATRLLRALGFGADRVSLVGRLRCHGCPRFPFVTMKTVGMAGAEGLYRRAVDYGDHLSFDWVSVERRFEGIPIESETHEGWAWYELDAIDEASAGAPRAHVDALRLIAAFLAHWDNKSENQRLVCPPDAVRSDGTCARPFALIHDLGSTFGPRKVDLDGWRRAPIWRDRAACLVSLETLPYQGATFKPVRISEGGRRFLAGLLRELRDEQITALFQGARFDWYHKLLSSPAELSDWVSTFRDKVRQIADGPPCATSDGEHTRGVDPASPDGAAAGERVHLGARLTW